jgi:hypothetical protein
VEYENAILEILIKLFEGLQKQAFFMLQSVEAAHFRFCTFAILKNKKLRSADKASYNCNYGIK